MEVIGIDLGTTNCVATVYDEQKLKHITFDGDFLLPSVVNISDNGVIVGVKAKNMAMIAIDDTAISIKRSMGTDKKIRLNNKDYTPAEISSFIIKKILQTTEEEMGQKYTKCVVTVPAYFNEKQREDTAEAVKLAGLEVLRILNEPTAAAVSYGADKDEDLVYAVYDLGGGTFDVSVMENSEGLIEVLSTMGDNFLGGDDFDKKLSNLILEKSGLKIQLTKQLEVKLLQIAQDTKVQLTNAETLNIDEKFFAKVDNKALHLEVEITKGEFEALIEEDISKTIDLLLEAIEDSSHEVEEIDSIILTGGSSRIPLISRMILERIDKLPILIEDPDKSVSIGAIIQAAMIEGLDTDSILVDITPYSLGTEVVNEDDEHVLSKIILKNTPVPTSKTSRFFAASPYQSRFEINVFQGEIEEELEQNVKIGTIMLEVDEPVEDGAVDITFTLSSDGILDVQGVEVHTGEKIHGQFKTKLSKSANHSSVSSMNVLSEHEKSLILKIDEILSKDEILDVDKEDLKALKKKYIAASVERKASLEEEIIDTIFFLAQ
jgi:molecular chaperone DnaK (HSP70)